MIAVFRNREKNHSTCFMHRTMASGSDPRESSRRKALKVAVSALCHEAGFDKAEDSSLETLTEMLQSFLTELGRSTQSYAELAGRTQGMMTDVIMSLVDMGQNIHNIPGHARRHNKTVFLPPVHTAVSPVLKTLQAGDKQTHPSHIPDHLPAFPDPHTYIRTLTHKPPVNDYQVIREKASSQKRDVERALTRFIAKTGETQSLFKDNNDAYPLIAVKPSPLPYLNALLPKDQDLDISEDLDSRTQQRDRGQTIGSGTQAGGQGSSNNDPTDLDSIDNPYLRPVKQPRYRKKLNIS